MVVIMANRNTVEWSGSESIKYMKKSNVIRAIFWVIVLAICVVAIQLLVANQYRQIGTAESVRNFRQMLKLGWIYLLCLSLIWWFGATNEFAACAAIRDFFERRSLHCAAGFDILAFVGVLIIDLRGGFGILAQNDHFYTLYCPFILSAVFICLMYAVPPVNIQEVVFPGKGRRWLTAGLAGLVAAVLFIVDFFV